MSKINVLSSKIYNRIAAGEVVERPSSIVKELIENSLDAGATKITVKILDGGISYILVSDNGEGIEKSQLKNALLPHATSKISKLEDLDNINSFGFRGEALASIASVAKVSISSKTKEQESGAEIYAEGGRIEQVLDCSCPNGTEILVQNLFFNTPARAKFLHKPRTEESEVTATVKRFILSNPKVSFTYVVDGEDVMRSYGEGLEPAMVCLYGGGILKNTFYIDADRNGIKINGYISRQHFTKPNRSHQIVFLNGRYIVNQTISSAIANAYSTYLMKRQYPFYVLNITVPTEIVDVNVHPNKLDVRFSDNQIVYGTIYTVISKVLDGTADALNIITENKTESAVDLKKTPASVLRRERYPKYFEQPMKKFIIELNDNVTKSLEEITPVEELRKQTQKETVDIFAENKAFLEKLDAEKRRQEVVQQEVKIDREFRIIGQALNTYLILDDGVDVYFIDQHAAHERILFDKLNSSVKNNSIDVQPLLVPFVLNVNNLEFDFLLNKKQVLNSMGIEFDEFGRNAFKVSALPVFLSEMNVEKFFNEIIGEINQLKDITVNDILMEKLAQKACKSAIKSGDKMSDSDIKALLDSLKNNLGLKCPHGRPIAIKLTRMEIDKWFKRIV